MSFSDFLELKILDHVFGNAAYTAPTTVYAALFTTNPNSETGSGGTEVSGGSYARVAITNNSTNFPAASAGSKSNGTTITFATPTANWGTVTGVGLYDASTAGNLLVSAALTVSKTINTGDSVTFASGQFTVTLN